MIKQTRNGWKFKGTEPELLTELTNIVRGMNETLQKAGRTEEEAKEMIQKSVELGLKSDDELFKESINKVLSMLGIKVREANPEYKIWCETDEIRDKVLVALENRELKFPDGNKPTQCDDVSQAPMGFVVEGDLFMVRSDRKVMFDKLECKEMNAEDLIKEAEGNE